jgi:hypothetical protein
MRMGKGPEGSGARKVGTPAPRLGRRAPKDGGQRILASWV